MDEKWDDLKAPVRDAGQGNQLNTFPEFSVAFWRWSIWKLFEADSAPGRGVIAFISNRKFLTGWPYAGLRKMLRERFDRIEIIDLRGDVRRGARAGVEGDEGVFNIMVGTSITLAIADGTNEDELAEIRYTDMWDEERFSRNDKLSWLAENANTGLSPNFAVLDGTDLEDFRPASFGQVDWPSITDLFSYSVGGMQTKRNELVYAPRRETLEARLRGWLARPLDDVARAAFRETRDRRADAAHAQQFDPNCMTAVAYRPFDVRILYNNRAFGDFLRPALQAAWGTSNFALYTHHFGVNQGPAILSHCLLPDYDLWCGRGGYAFPLYDRREGPNATNVSPSLIAGLSATYGQPVAPEDIFDAILALLSATSYTRRFAEDLEDTFPHIPFPADHAVFQRAVEVGREIRAVETFSRVPAAQPAAFCRLESQPTGDVASVDYAEGEIELCDDGSGRISGIPKTVWDFAVSGYRVLPRWIEGRIGLPADLALIREFRDVAARIAELIHRFDEADLVLADALADSLTREELGLAGAEADEGEDGQD